ncbi:hypothetical protein AQUCO_00300337v1 [Aquilegia coerulea]|uniref:Uncharacterized protein n=1 Tax=Aquilegia coerulea TaxID=218851 RepID=A0A2G5EYG0_AQUCA|nr:hypothetical protein AQUCO_00300337v1 [Aquilegia coerulea]
MAHFWTMPWLLFFQFLVLIVQTRAKIPAVIIFGDSSVDSGNNNQLLTILKSNFEPYGRDFSGGEPTGRFSNGKVPGDFVSEAFGCKPTVPAYLDPSYGIKDFATGVNFASAGTGYDNATSEVLNVMPLWKELEYYKDYQKKLHKYMGFKKANKTLRDAVYLISLGTNDFMENYYLLGRRALEFNIEQYQDFLTGIARNFVNSLYSLGARKIALVGLPPMGCLPLERLQNLFHCNEKYNKVAQDFNGKLHALVTNLNKELPGIQLVYSDIYGVLLDIIQKPYRYGFENAVLACCGSGMFEMGYLCNQFNPFTCADANKYVFWDAFHPTEKTNQIVSSYFVKNVLAKFL